LAEGQTISSGSSASSSSDSGIGGTHGEFVGEEVSGDNSEGVLEVLSRGVNRFLNPNYSDKSTQTLKDPLVWETEKLAFDIVFFTTGKRTNKPSDDVMRCLRNSVKKMLDNHHMVFNGMMSRLKIDRDCNIELGFTTLAEELFINTGSSTSNHGVSWGKIIALYAFGARLAQHCNDNGLEDLVFDIAGLLAAFAVRRLTPFLRQNGGWPTLCDAFPMQSDYEATMWTSLLVTGLGLTTVAAFVALMR